MRIFEFLRYNILRDRGIGDASVCSSWSTQLPWAGILEPGWLPYTMCSATGPLLDGRPDWRRYVFVEAVAINRQ
jgi:hypothetical protein